MYVCACVRVCACVYIYIYIYVYMHMYIIGDDAQLAQLVRAWTVNPEVIGSIPAKTQKTENPNLHEFELNRHSSKGTKLLLQVITAIIILCIYVYIYLYIYIYIRTYIYVYIYAYIYTYM